MNIKIRGARENNLKNLDVDIGDDLTAVTGVSGSGKSSLIFDTLYKETRRRFLEAFSINKDEIKLNPAKVRSITGVGPTIALAQNILNRNPNSTVASAIGLIPLLKILYTRYGKRVCHICGTRVIILKVEEIIVKIKALAEREEIKILVQLIRNLKGSHQTLLNFLTKRFLPHNIIIDNNVWNKEKLKAEKPHTINIYLTQFNEKTPINDIRVTFKDIVSLGAHSLIIEGKTINETFTYMPTCIECGAWFEELEPTHFKISCPHCKGKGCEKCNQTGLHPYASRVTWSDLRFTDILKKSIGNLLDIFSKDDINISNRLYQEISNRLKALHEVGLNYLTLDRSSPTLSRGESQRVRLAIILMNKLEDVTHILDEPTIGLHPADISKILSIFQKLKGPVIYIEHDSQAVAYADNVIDIGPGAGNEGGNLIFTGTPAELWKADTPSGNYFSKRKKGLSSKIQCDPSNIYHNRRSKKT
ncbi:MAG: hypothetical protein ACFFG0_26985 [Candidatus Thorarchaeota archaeon]